MDTTKKLSARGNCSGYNKTDRFFYNVQLYTPNTGGSETKSTSNPSTIKASTGIM